MVRGGYPEERKRSYFGRRPSTVLVYGVMERQTEWTETAEMVEVKRRRNVYIHNKGEISETFTTDWCLREGETQDYEGKGVG